MLLAVYSSGQCPTPKKKRYASEDEAYVAADYTFDATDVTLEPYHCACGLWHLTTPMGMLDQPRLTRFGTPVNAKNGRMNRRRQSTRD